MTCKHNSKRVDPRAGEGEDDFVERCMGSEQMQSEFPDQDQRLAVCFSKFQDRNKQDISTSDLDQGGRLNPEQGRRCPPGTRWDADKQMCVVEETFAAKVDAHGCTADQRYDGKLGRCVAKELTEEWSPEKALQSLKNEHEHRLDMRKRIRQEPGVGLSSLGNRQVDEREDPDPFLLFELEFARSLAERAFKLADEDILPLYDDQVLPRNPTFFNRARLEDANDRAETIWRDAMWTVGLGAAAALALSRAFFSGESQIAPGITAGAPSTQQVLDNMVRVANFNSNEFFRQQVLPALNRRVEAMFQDTAAFDQVDLAPVRTVLDRRLKSVPYWRVVANAATSRAYHYGVLKAAQFQGFRGYRFVAILDDRTSDICREIHGREWFIADAVSRFERVAGSDDPDEVKTIFPWVNVEDVRGQSGDSLREMGVMVPPLHGNCRSTLRPIF